MRASEYVRENFETDDRLAVVLLDKRNAGVIQRLASAAQVASAEFQDWLRLKNDDRWDVYVSMNALRPEATGRTKSDIGAVRHLYLDFDEDGTVKMERLFQRSDLPRPNFRLNTSPGKWQVVWKVEGFTTDHAETLQRSMARQSGADWAATDCARVLRLPGFYNHKYSPPHFVTADALGDRIHRPKDFPVPALVQTAPMGKTREHLRASGGLSQSERDWAFAKRALARGEPQESVIAAIAKLRYGDKHNSQRYAEHTVAKAATQLRTALEGGPDR